MYGLFKLSDLIKSDPVVRLIRTSSLRPILASHAPKVRRISIENRSIFFTRSLIIITKVRIIDSKINKSISRWFR